MSFIGAKVSQYLSNISKGRKVVPIEDAINIEPDPMRWYRWTKLSKSGLSTTLVDFGSDVTLKNFKKLLANAVTTNIVYVPTGVIELSKIEDPVKRYQIATSHVAHFNKLLSTLLMSKVSKFIMISSTNNNQIHKIWMTTIEQSLLSFYHQTSRTINAMIIKVNNVFGPWQDSTNQDPQSSWWYIDDIGRIVHKLITGQSTHNHDLELNDINFKFTAFADGMMSTLKWGKMFSAYLEQYQTKNVMSGAYLAYTSKYDSILIRSKAKKYDIKYFADWISSSLAYNLSIALIYDAEGLSQELVNKMQKVSPKIDLAKYSPVNERISHDQRFYMLYDYLLKHPEIKYFNQ